MGSRAGQDALILRILRGDHGAMQHAVARLAGPDAEDAAGTGRPMLGGLAEALIARSIEASAFDFPTDHFFWGAVQPGPVPRHRGGAVVARLPLRRVRRLGRRARPEPARPLAGRRLRGPRPDADPPLAERGRDARPARDVRVAADEYVAEAAGGLTLGELVTLLGRRADGAGRALERVGHRPAGPARGRLTAPARRPLSRSSPSPSRRQAGVGPSSSSSSMTTSRSASAGRRPDRLALLGGPRPDPLRRASPAP